MIYVFDIDGTICTKLCENKGQDYRDALPSKNRIKQINSLYDAGHTIILLTARGMGRSNNNQTEAHAMFFDLTRAQLKKWGIKYHELFLGKPAADFYIDDKGINDGDFFKDGIRP